MCSKMLRLLLLPALSASQYIPSTIVESPPAEATAVKSWGLLKESVGSLGDQVMQMMEVRKDIEAMQEDLKTQEVLWHQGEVELKQERAKLEEQLKALQAKATSGETIKAHVDNLRHQLDVEKNTLVLQKDHLASDEAQRASLRKDHLARQQHLTEELQAMEHQILAEAHDGEKSLNSLRADGVALSLKKEELTARIKDLKVEDEANQKKDALELQDLKLQHEDMKSGFEKLKGSLEAPGSLKKKLQGLQKQFEEETGKLLALQQKHSEEGVECQGKLQELKEVLSSEKSKEKARHEEMLSLCLPIRAQAGLLEQQLRECQTTVTLPPTLF